MSSNTSVALPRTVASVAKGGVIFGAGLALGLVTVQMQGAYLASADGAKSTIQQTKSAQSSVRVGDDKKESGTSPAILYRSAPTSGTSSTGSGSGIAPAQTAPQPAAAKAPAATTSKTS